MKNPEMKTHDCSQQNPAVLSQKGFSAENFAYNVQRHIKRVGVSLVAVSLCASTMICVGQENRAPKLSYKGITVSAKQGITDTLDAVCKASYADIIMKQADYAELARLEGAEKVAEDKALAAEKKRKDLAAAKKLAANKKDTTAVTGAKTSTAKNASESEYGEYLGTFTITAYCPCKKCCGKTNGKTASGKIATANHTVAASSKFAFGTELVIGGKVYTVEDRGGAIKGNRIDIFFASHKAALQFGRKKMKVYRYQ